MYLLREHVLSFRSQTRIAGRYFDLLRKFVFFVEFKNKDYEEDI